MATGAYDAQDIWQYGEDDPASPFSDLLNLLAESTSDGFAADRARLSAVEGAWKRLSGSAVFTPALGISVQAADAVYLPGFMATVHIRLADVTWTAGAQATVLGTVTTALRPTTYFAPISGWPGGFLAGLVAPADGQATIRYAVSAATGDPVLSGSWPLAA